MKKYFLFAVCILIAGMSIAQDLKPKKDKATKKYGYINSKEEWVVKPEYDDADKIKDRFGKIYLKKKEGLINEKGEVIIAPYYDDIEKFRDGVAKVKLGRKYGIINNQGKPITGLVFIELEDFNGGVAWMRKDSLTGKSYTTCSYGLIDKTGKEIFAPQFSEIPKFDSKGNAIAEMYENRVIRAPKFYGVINKDGRVLLKLEYKNIVAEGDQYLVCNKNDKWSILSNDFKQVGGEFEEFKTTQKKLSTFYFMDGLMIAKKDGKYGFIDKTAKTIIQFKYDVVNPFGFTHGLCAVKEGDYWAYIDKQGKYFKKPIYEEAKIFESSDAMIRKSYPNIAEGAIFAFVTFNGEECVLYNDGRLTQKTSNAPVDDTKPLKKRGNTSTSSEISTTSEGSNASSISTTTTESTNSSSSEQKKTSIVSSPDNAWLLGKWTVVEENQGGGVRKGDNTQTAYFNFSSATSMIQGERDVVTKQITDASKTYKVDGTTLMIGRTKYTIVLSPDSKTITIKGMLNTYWKAVK